MNNLVTINNHELPVKEYNGQRVVTLKEIDTVHDRPEGTARKRFNDNKQHFIDGVDFFKVKCSEVRPFFGQTPPIGFNPVADIILITESGYLMLVKSFTDDLAWAVQRQLVNTYFRVAHDPDMSDLSPELRLLISLERKQKAQDRVIEAVNLKVDSIRAAALYSPDNWRQESQNMVHRIAQQSGGYGLIRDIQADIFRLVDERAGVSLSRRLENMRMRAAAEGTSKTNINRMNNLDVIAQDKKLVEIYVSIVREMAIRHGITTNKEEF